jgi:hypothetical protein
MTLDADHASAVLAASSPLDLPREAVAAAAQREGLEWIKLEDGAIDIDVPIPLILKVDAWFHFALEGGGTLLTELWGEAYGRDYGLRVSLLGKPGLEVYSSPPGPQVPPEVAVLVGELRWERGVARLAEYLEREIDPRRLRTVLGEAWPGPLAEIWEALVTRY